MKRMKKGLSLFFVAFLSLIFIIPTTKALANQTEIINVGNTSSISADSLNISNITFHDNSTSSTLSFGLTADVTNSSSNIINYDAIIYYYDLNNNLITTAFHSGIVTQNQSKLNFMSNLNLLGKYNVQDIKYYRLLINTKIADSSNSYTPSTNNKYDSYDYVIDQYDINMIVNEDNTFDITETITAYFKVPKHGIYRKIPLKNQVNRLDGTKSTNRAKISNLNVNNMYEFSKSSGIYNIQIGDPDKTVTGKHTYTIKYNYNIGKDPIKDYDELYYNIIGNEWDTVIGNVSFSITMPKEFDSSKLGFSSGTKGSIDNSNVIYSVNKNTITGDYIGILNPGEALTIRAELPEGYFDKATNNVTIQDYLIYIVPIASLIISAILWFIYGRDNKVIETVEFYPPEGFDSLEVGFLYKGAADNTDVTSLLIYLANKGYIQITETNEKTLFATSKNFKITKLKDYDGNNINERLFLEGLFKSSSKEVTISSLYNSFYITVNQILENINSKENKQKIFEQKASSKKKNIIIMMIISYILITAVPVLNYGNTSELIFALLFPGIAIAVILYAFIGTSSSIPKYFAIIWGALFGGFPWCFMVLPSLTQDNIYLFGYLIGFICLIIMVIFLKHISKRTPYGLEILGKIKGFKNYLETAEKDKLEAMVIQNPNYFYDILPYTYVLGISDKWIKKFETITIQSPNWYVGTSTFSMVTFGTFMNTAMSSATTAMSSSPRSSSGSSGGGSSGGGSGGGGGGSW